MSPAGVSNQKVGRYGSEVDTVLTANWKLPPRALAQGNQSLLNQQVIVFPRAIAFRLRHHVDASSWQIDPWG